MLDTSRGARLTLPSFTYPRTRSEGRAQKHGWDQLVNSNPGLAAGRQESTDRTKLTERLQTANPATRQRTEDILAAISRAIEDPEVAPLYKQALARHDEFQA